MAQGRGYGNGFNMVFKAKITRAYGNKAFAQRHGVGGRRDSHVAIPLMFLSHSIVIAHNQCLYTFQ